MSTKKFKPESPKPKIDLNSAADVQCQVCNNYTFVEVVMVKRVSAILSPNGKEGYLPIPVFACNACGFVNDEFLPSFAKNKEPETPAITDNLTAPSPSPTKLILSE